MTQPRIGITSRFDPYSKAPVSSCGVRIPFLESIIEAGGTPLIIPLCKPGIWLDELYQELDGVLLPGGGDIHPRRFAQDIHPKTGPICELRDEIELILAKKCAIDKKPLLGICRGVQVMNVALGGTLIQDIPDQTKSKVNHRQDSDDKFLDATGHDVVIEPNSMLAKLVGKVRAGVNSFHHQAIDRLGHNLRSVAASSDDLIEAVELDNHPFYLGVQWHPELMWQKAEAGFLNIFQAFVKAAGITH
jgi:putative glutamine amidotransferase